MLLLASLSIFGVIAMFIVFFKYKQRRKNKILTSNMEYRPGHHKGDAHRNKYIGLKSETDQRSQNAACASVKQDVSDADASNKWIQIFILTLQNIQKYPFSFK